MQTQIIMSLLKNIIINSLPPQAKHKLCEQSGQLSSRQYQPEQQLLSEPQSVLNLNYVVHKLKQLYFMVSDGYKPEDKKYKYQIDYTNTSVKSIIQKLKERNITKFDNSFGNKTKEVRILSSENFGLLIDEQLLNSTRDISDDLLYSMFALAVKCLVIANSQQANVDEPVCP